MSLCRSSHITINSSRVSGQSSLPAVSTINRQSTSKLLRYDLTQLLTSISRHWTIPLPLGLTAPCNCLNRETKRTIVPWTWLLAILTTILSARPEDKPLCQSQWFRIGRACLTSCLSTTLTFQ
jgi:hypothetical protein